MQHSCPVKKLSYAAYPIDPPIVHAANALEELVKKAIIKEPETYKGFLRFLKVLKKIMKKPKVF